MLQYLDNVYLKVASVDRKDPIPPTVFLDIYLRDNAYKSSSFIGQIRFNFDPSYSKIKEEIRMSFNLIFIDPYNVKLLENIIVAGFLWITLDNHYTYEFVPKPYMAIHNYKEDSPNIKFTNSCLINILNNLKCEKKHDDMYIFSKDTTSKYLSDKLSSSYPK